MIMRFNGVKALAAVLGISGAAAGAFAVYVWQDRKALQVQVSSKSDIILQERAAARQWMEQAGLVQDFAERLDQVAMKLDEAKRERERQAREVDAKISAIRIEYPEVHTFLEHRAPDRLLRILCDDGTIDPSSPDCRALGAAELPDRLPED